MAKIKSSIKTKHTKRTYLNPEVSNNPFNKYYLLIVILFVTALVFSNSTNNDFVNYDDNVYVLNNKYIKDFSANGITEIFKSYSDDMLPVTLFSLAIDYKLWGLNPKPYHIENIIFHLINILLVFILISKITKKKEVALITALLFAIHPLRVESVVWIAERKDMLLGLFYLSSLICYLNYIKSNRKVLYLILSIVFSILALMSKLSAITIPFVLILLDYYFSRKFSLKLVLEKLPFFIMPVVSGLIHYQTDESALLLTRLSSSFNFIDSIFFAGYSVFFYLYMLILPINMSALHPYPPKVDGFLPAEYYIYTAISIVIISLLVYLIYKAKNFRKGLIFGFAFFFITISIVLQIIPFGGWAIVAERYTYIPYIGLFFLIGKTYSWIKSNVIRFPFNIKPIYLIITFAIICCFLTYNRNTVWKNTETLFADVLDKDSTVFFAYNNRGFYRFQQGNVEGSLSDFNKTIKINPDFIDGYNNRGNLYNETKQYDKAILDFNKVISANPNYSSAYNNRGNTKVGLEDYKGSIDDYSMAIKTNPDYAIAYNNRGSIYCNNLNNMETAITDFTKAISLDKNYGQAYFNRAVCYLNLRDLQNACTDFTMAYNLGYMQAGDFINKYCMRSQ